MTYSGAGLSRVLIGKVSEWLEHSALVGMDLEAIVTGTCDRLQAAGVPLRRVHLSFSMLHPLYDALGFTWLRGEGVTIDKISARSTDVKPERFLTSPYFHLLSHRLEHLRRRIEPSGPVEFPIFTDLREMGVTDYFAFVQSFGDSAGRGMLGSWSTDAIAGFDDDMIESLLHIQQKLAVTAKMTVLNKLAENMMSTYLGPNAGRRVLEGQTRRGDTETIRAVLAMVDMRDSTKLAEHAGREAYVETLNQFFDAVATPFHRNGLEILNFIGDGFLAVYPCERHNEASQRATRAAMAAAAEATARLQELNSGRGENGLPPISYGVGLHVGNVMYGNVGLKNRLTFSTFGAAVNEAQRLEDLTKKFGKTVIASQTFADYAGGEWEMIGRERLHGLDGEVSVFSPADLAALPALPAPTDHEVEDRRSEAEQLMLLYRDRLQMPPFRMKRPMQDQAH